MATFTHLQHEKSFFCHKKERKKQQPEYTHVYIFIYIKKRSVFVFSKTF